MLKLFVLFLSFFQIQTNSNYQIVSKETTDYNNVVFYEDGIILRNLCTDTENKYSLFVEGNKYEINASYASGKIIDNYFLLIYYQNEQLYAKRYFLDGTFDEKLLIYQGNIYGDITIKNIDKSIYIAFTDYIKLNDNSINYDCHLVHLYYDEANIYINEHNYGGLKKELLESFDIYDENLYFVVRKDHITESVFGNGGCDDCYVIALIDGNSVISSVTIKDTNEIRYFCIRNGYIYLVLGDKLYLFNTSFELLNTIMLDKLKHLYVGYNNTIMVLYDDRIELLNGLSLAKLFQENVNGITEYKEFSNSLYCNYQNKHYIFDIIDYSKTLLLDKYVYEHEELLNNKVKEVSSLFGDCIFVSKKYHDYYQRNAYGNYDIDLEYQTNGKIAFQKTIQEEVALEININNNQIYPNGYRLNFNGTGYLDGNLIIPNHPVTVDGFHTLEVVGVNTQTKIDFYVSTNQLAIVDKYFNDELINIKPNEKFSVSYDLNKEIDITDLVVYGGNISEYKILNNKLVITFEGFSEVGLNKIILEKIVYKENYYEDEIYLNKLINVNVYLDEIAFNDAVINEDCGCTFDFTDKQKQARYLEIRFINKINDFVFNYPIGDQVINVDGVSNGTYQMIVALKYDNMCYGLNTKEIYRMDVVIDNKTVLGKVKLLESANDYYKVLLTIDNNFKSNNIIQLKNNNNVIFNYQDYQKELIVKYSVIFFITSFIIGFTIRITIKKKKLKK